MRSIAKSFRKQIKDMVAKGTFSKVPKFSSFDEIMKAVGSGVDSFLSSVVLDSISDNGRRPVAVTNPDELYAAVMQNPYLSRFFKTLLYYTISFSRAWDDEHQAHNFDPEEKRDDWTDMTVTLYAGPGDLIVTEDKKLCGAVTMVNLDSKIRTVLARKL
jgi:hypothetical protein